MDKTLIRRANPDDVTAIAQLWRQLIQDHQALDTALPRPTPDGPHRYAQRLLERLSDPHTCVLVAEENGQLVGFTLGAIIDPLADIFQHPKSGFLADIYVTPSHRRRGIGRALVTALTQWFRQNGVDFFEWHVAAHNPEGLAFWRALGGREVLLRMRAYCGDNEHDRAPLPD